MFQISYNKEFRDNFITSFISKENGLNYGWLQISLTI